MSLDSLRTDNESYYKMEHFQEVPLTALQQSSKEKLSLLLNCKKILPSESGFHRDWRGLAALVKLDQNEFGAILHSDDHMMKLIEFWIQKFSDAKIIQLIQYLAMIDRFDVSDDIELLCYEDARTFLFKSPEKLKTFEKIPADPDNDIITNDDFNNTENGEPLQIYDAFLLYCSDNEEDVKFAFLILQRMEECGYKICVKDRDFLGGLTFEHDAILRLLNERCRKVIVVVSQAFYECQTDMFFVKFTQKLGIKQDRRKIIPCYREVLLNPHYSLSCYTRIDFYRDGLLYDFWGKLKNSLRWIKPRDITKQTQSTSASKDLKMT